MSDLDFLWGGVIKQLDLDLAAHTVLISLETLTAGVAAEYQLSFAGVTLFTSADEGSDSWDYVELTEIRTSAMPNGQVIAEMVLWSEPAGIRVIADALSVEVGGRDIEIIQSAVETGVLVRTSPQGVQTFRRLLPDGMEVWAEVYEGQIINGGANGTPRLP